MNPIYDAEGIIALYSLHGNLGNDKTFFLIVERGVHDDKKNSSRMYDLLGEMKNTPVWKLCFYIKFKLNDDEHFFDDDENNSEFKKIIDELSKNIFDYTVSTHRADMDYFEIGFYKLLFIDEIILKNILKHTLKFTKNTFEYYEVIDGKWDMTN